MTAPGPHFQVHLDPQVGIKVYRMEGGRRVFKYTIAATPTIPEESLKSLAALEALATDPRIWIDLVRAAMFETLIREYAKRMAASEDTMTDLRRVGKYRSPKVPFNDRNSYQEPYRPVVETSKAEIGKDVGTKATDEYQTSSAGEDAQTAEGQFVDRIVEAAERQNTSIPLKSVPDFTSRLRMVQAELFRGLNPKTTILDDGNGILGFGNLPKLEQIKTPTNRGYPTTSPFNIMWRQLEFGTGYYAVAAGGPFARTTGKHKAAAPQGSWWYGRQYGDRHTGIQLLGTRPGAFLRQATGVPYGDDGFKFTSAVYVRLARLLRGQL